MIFILPKECLLLMWFKIRARNVQIKKRWQSLFNIILLSLNYLYSFQNINKIFREEKTLKMLPCWVKSTKICAPKLLKLTIGPKINISIKTHSDMHTT